MEPRNNLPIAARAQAAGRIPTRDAFLFRSGEAIALAAGEAGKPRKFRMTAISGIPFQHPWWGNFVIDVETVKFKSQKFPILRDHMSDHIVGWSDKASKDGKVDIEGTFSEISADGREVAGLLSEGFPWEASVFARPGRIESIQEGAEAKVNGKTVKGPGTVFRDTLIVEASFTAIGADPRTNARAFSGGESEYQIIYAFSQAGEAGKEPMDEVKKVETPAPAVTTAPAAPMTFSQADLDSKVSAALKADREARTKLAKDIQEIAAPGQEKLAQELIEKEIPIAEAMRALLLDAKEKLSGKRAAFTKDPGASVAPDLTTFTSAKKEEQSSGKKIEEKDLILGRGEIDEEKAKAKFAASPELRKEFYGDEKNYLAFLKAESRGQVQTIVPQY